MAGFLLESVAGFVGIRTELAGLVAEGMLDVPVAATFPLADVRAAFRQLEQGHTRGKIVLTP